MGSRWDCYVAVTNSDWYRLDIGKTLPPSTGRVKLRPNETRIEAAPLLQASRDARQTQPTGVHDAIPRAEPRPALGFEIHINEEDLGGLRKRNVG